ncbi:S9 family peptidase [Segeticoccus rhizosphaerae]|uniref:S9 family peptidase n=1 Tax=Segeticoccus rhizosphaerae TaxID=1104777 RepID=UPI0010C0E87B|nr:S9 family peptidase [Ornithinicoccus soli]
MTTSSPVTRPFGAWRSPVSAASVAGDTVGLGAVRLDDGDVYWIESRPGDGGRSVLVRCTPGGARQDVTPGPYNVRSRVHEYGGGAYAVRHGLVLFVNFVDQRVYRLDRDDPAPHAITPEGTLRYGDLRLDTERGVAYAVREDHSDPQAEPVNTLVRLDLEGPNGDGGTVLVGDTDFVVGPELSPDGTHLAWLQWDHPNMPWDDTTVWLGTLDAAGDLTDRQIWAGAPGRTVGEPRWAPDGRLVHLSDHTGFANLYAGDLTSPESSASPLLSLDREFGQPQWQLGTSTYGFTGDGRVVCTWLEDGFARMGLLDPADGQVRLLETGATAYGSLAVAADQVVFMGGFVDAPSAVVRVSLVDGSTEVLRRSSDERVDPRYLSRPERVSWQNTDGETVHGFFHRPANADFTAPEGELPPLIVSSHGGPTSMAPPAFSPSDQYWTSRGFALLEVNYSGSTGYGRAYRERLKGRWGLVDVDDCATGAVAMADEGRVDRARLAIHGGSAGGYTTLAALTFRDVFAAGASHFGISDLAALARDTHKFESQYPTGLVGPYPEAKDAYAARSPIEHLDRLGSQMILLQGTEDEVVPRGQAELMADALRRKGLPVSLVLFEGEGHGFRRAENIVAALEAEAYFFSQVLGFTLADPVPAVQIDNFPPPRTDTLT